MHPNVAKIFFQIPATDLAVSSDHGLTVGRAVPAAILNPFHDTDLLRTFRGQLGINAGPP